MIQARSVSVRDDGQTTLMVDTGGSVYCCGGRPYTNRRHQRGMLDELTRNLTYTSNLH